VKLSQKCPRCKTDDHASKLMHTPPERLGTHLAYDPDAERDADDQARGMRGSRLRSRLKTSPAK